MGQGAWRNMLDGRVKWGGYRYSTLSLRMQRLEQEPGRGEAARRGGLGHTRQVDREAWT